MKTLEYLPPAALTVGANVRHDTRLAGPFVASIRARGVLEPVLAHREPDGSIVVDQGQRRTLAAAQVELDVIPVIVDDTVPDDEDRLIDQVVENEHRAALTNSELVGAVEQAALFGLDVDLLAKRAQLPFDQVALAARVAKSPLAREKVDGITLEDAAAIAEFDDDPDTVDEIVDIINRGWRIDHEIERVRQRRAEDAAIATVTAELTAAGIHVIPAPGWEGRGTALALDDLRDGRRKIDPEKHATDCKGHVAWVQFGYSSRQTGTPDVTLGCINWRKNGHTTTAPEIGSGKAKAEDMSDEERAQSAKARRHVIDSNKAWKACTTVRRRWLHEFAGRAQAPAGAEQLIALATIEGWPHSLGCYGVLDASEKSMTAALAKGGPKRALQLALATVLACWEDELADDAWRSTYQVERTKFVLQNIAQWGYELSDIEQAIIDGTAAQAA